ncbi:MAG: M42 family metallopeptidase [Clostridiales bacterium]|nr:M42 family metallopeptidase [Clostridiales bacterium]
MNTRSVISRLVTAPGATGHEEKVGDVVLELFSGICDDVWCDKYGDIYAKIGSGEPTVLICAHLDEVSMIVTDILENGMLKICSLAGVDPRVLPGSEVVVDGKVQLKGIIGAVPPHLLTGKENAAYKIDDLTVDLGLPFEKVRELVVIGDIVRFDPIEPLELKNGRIAGKTLDDRAHVAVMIKAIEILKKRLINCTAVFCASVQEEKTGLGATLSTYNVRPDIGIAIDVTHGPTPGAGEYDCFPLDKLVLTRGSNIHPKVYKMLKKAGDDIGIPTVTEAAMGHTGTDAWSMQVTAGGCATGLISTPLKYMHTNVELLDVNTLENCAKLLAQFIANIDEDWEAQLCLDD